MLVLSRSSQYWNAKKWSSNYPIFVYQYLGLEVHFSRVCISKLENATFLSFSGAMFHNEGNFSLTSRLKMRLENCTHPIIDWVAGDVNTRRCAHTSWQFPLFFARWCACKSWFVQVLCLWNSHSISYSSKKPLDSTVDHLSKSKDQSLVFVDKN